MEKKDLIAHSPVRYFDNATSAGLKDGEMGLVTAKKGLGKTSILVQFGIDSLLNDKALVHVSFDQQSSNVIAWYSSVMAEVAKKKNINLDEVSEEIVRNRTILNFNQETFTLPKKKTSMSINMVHIFSTLATKGYGNTLMNLLNSITLLTHLLPYMKIKCTIYHST